MKYLMKENRDNATRQIKRLNVIEPQKLHAPNIPETAQK